jgi:IclR family pca regulon transcriptional regulator
VLDGDDIVYVARVSTKRIMTVAISVGTRFPAYATSMGRVLLAALPADDLDERLARMELRALTPRTVTDADALREILDGVRRDGFAMVDQELEQGLRSAAVPIHDASGAVLAALNVSVHASRASMEALRAEFLPPAQEAAAAIEGELRRTGVRAAAPAPRRKPAG